MTRNTGFTLVDVVATVSVLGIVVTIAIPAFSTWLPDQRLKTAARDLYSNMQLMKVGAIKSNAQWAIVFDAGATPGRYFICSDDGANDTWDGAGGLEDMGADADFRVTKGRYAIHWNVANNVVTNPELGREGKARRVGIRNAI